MSFAWMIKVTAKGGSGCGSLVEVSSVDGVTGVAGVCVGEKSSRADAQPSSFRIYWLTLKPRSTTFTGALVAKPRITKSVQAVAAVCWSGSSSFRLRSFHPIARRSRLEVNTPLLIAKAISTCRNWLRSLIFAYSVCEKTISSLLTLDIALLLCCLKGFLVQLLNLDHLMGTILVL